MRTRPARIGRSGCPSLADIVATLVPREHVARIWPHVAPHLAEALQRGGDYSLDGAKARVADGVWLLWIAARPGELVAAALTDVEEYDEQTVVYVHAAGGSEGEGVAAMWPLVREYARGKGAKVLRFTGRRGWTRSKFIPPCWRHVSDVVQVEV